MNTVPFDSKTSAERRIVKGQSTGMTGFRAFSARAPVGQQYFNQILRIIS